MVSKEMVMDARILRLGMFFLLYVLCISDGTIAENPYPKAIRASKKMDYQDDQMFFSTPMVTTQRQNNVPIVNPSPPGSTPIVNPTTPPFGNPTPPFTTTPTITPPTPTFVNPPIPPSTNPPTPPSPTTTGPTPTSPSTSGGSWCIASPSASQTALQVALDYACGYGGADCSAIQPNGVCHDPDTVRDHASYAFNDYYQKNPAPTSCAFGGAAQLTNTDPSHGNCRYASSSSNTPTTTPMTPPTIPMTPPTLPMTPPSTTTPMSPFTPGGGNGFGPDPTGGFDNGFAPTGTPSSAAAISLNLLLLVAVNFLVSSVAIANYF